MENKNILIYLYQFKSIFFNFINKTSFDKSKCLYSFKIIIFIYNLYLHNLYLILALFDCPN